jgi:hypothetical protein
MIKHFHFDWCSLSVAVADLISLGDYATLRYDNTTPAELSAAKSATRHLRRDYSREGLHLAPAVFLVRFHLHWRLSL